MHYALTTAAAHDTEGFIAAELAARREPPYPPTRALVNLVVSGPHDLTVADAAERLATWCAALIASQQLEVEVLGPAPSALARIKDRWRWHVVLRGAGPALGRVVRYAATRMPQPSGTRVVIDRDPVSLL